MHEPNAYEMPLASAGDAKRHPLRATLTWLATAVFLDRVVMNAVAFAWPWFALSTAHDVREVHASYHTLWMVTRAIQALGAVAIAAGTFPLWRTLRRATVAVFMLVAAGHAVVACSAAWLRWMTGSVPPPVGYAQMTLLDAVFASACLAMCSIPVASRGVRRAAAVGVCFAALDLAAQWLPSLVSPATARSLSETLALGGVVLAVGACAWGGCVAALVLARRALDAAARPSLDA